MAKDLNTQKEYYTIWNFAEKQYCSKIAGFGSMILTTVMTIITIKCINSCKEWIQYYLHSYKNLLLSTSEVLLPKKFTSTEPPQTRPFLAVRERIELTEILWL